MFNVCSALNLLGHTVLVKVLDKHIVRKKNVVLMAFSGSCDLRKKTNFDQNLLSGNLG